jgi:hypothetical protein
MALTSTETLGFCDAVVEFMTNNQATLLAKGLNVTAWITELGTQKETAVTKNDEQEALKAALRTKTVETDTAFSAAYDSASTRLDAMIGVLGKTTPEGQQAARIRSDIRRGSTTPTPTPPTP